MAQALYLRETDGSRIILNQREQYGEVQIAQMKGNEGLQGGGVMEDTELSGLVRGFLNRQSGMNITVTESMLNELGDALSREFGDMNLYAQRRDENRYREALRGCCGMEKVLRILGISTETVQRKEDNRYAAVKIGDATFPVRTWDVPGRNAQ